MKIFAYSSAPTDYETLISIRNENDPQYRESPSLARLMIIEYFDGTQTTSTQHVQAPSSI